MDTALSLEIDPSYLLIAHDAVLMTLENRHGESRNRHRECLAMLPKSMDLEETYVSLFCRLHLVMYDDNRYYEELEELREKADKIGARWSLKRSLRFPSKSLLLEICGHRIPLDQKFKLIDRKTKPSRMYYRAELNGSNPPTS